MYAQWVLGSHSQDDAQYYCPPASATLAHDQQYFVQRLLKFKLSSHSCLETEKCT